MSDPMPTDQQKIDEGTKGEEKLLPCPFCGHNSPKRVTGYVYISPKFLPHDFWVECQGCGMTTAEYSDEQSADNAWNRRPSPPLPTSDVAKKVEELIREYEEEIPDVTVPKMIEKKNALNQLAAQILFANVSAISNAISIAERLKEADGLLKDTYEDAETFLSSNIDKRIAAFLARVSAPGAGSGAEGEGK